MWQWFLAQEAAGLLINCVAVFLSGYYIFEDDRIQYSLMALAALGLLGFLPLHSWSFLQRVALISRAVLVWGLLSLVCAFRIHPSPVIQLRLWGSAVRLRSLIPDESLQQFRTTITPQPEPLFWKLSDKDLESHLQKVPKEVRNLVNQRKTRFIRFALMPIHGSQPECSELVIQFEYGGGSRIEISRSGCTGPSVFPTSQRLEVRDGMWVIYSSEGGMR